MHKPRWSLIAREILEHRGRTLLVVLALAAGIFTVGVIGTTRAGLDDAIGPPYRATNPPDAVLATDPFDDRLVEAVRRVPGVRDAEGRAVLRGRLQVGPDEWRELELIALADYEAQRVDLVRPEAGAWPPAEREILVERGSLALIDAEAGDTLRIELPGGKRRTLALSGTAHHLLKPPAEFTGVARGYVALETLTWLGEERAYNQLLVITESAERDAILAAVRDVERQVERSGRAVFSSFLPTPGRHPSQEIIDPLLLTLGSLGGLSLAMSAFLIVNTIAGILARQVRQIGVMKAVGGTTGQLLGLYLALALGYGALAALLAVPLGALCASLLTGYLVGLVDVDMPAFRVPPDVLATQVALGLLTPLLAALVPALLAARTTVRAALSDAPGASPDRPAPGWLRRAGGVARRVRLPSGIRLSRPVRISLRNAFRRRGRLLFTLSALTLSGAMFVAVFGVRASVLRALDGVVAYRGYDVTVELDEARRTRALAQLALGVPGVMEVEGLSLDSVRLRLADGATTQPIDLVGVPAETTFLRPVVVRGRWLLPEDDNAVVLNTAALEDAPATRVGDIVTLRHGPSDEQRWQVVGIVQGVLDGPALYANRPYALRRAGETGRSRTILVRTASSDPEARAAAAAALDAALARAGVRVALVETTDQATAAIQSQFDIVLAFMGAMALLVAAVGGLGLSGTMGMNVMERTREIGVLRAVGASDGAVRRIVIVEGVVVGWMSWAAGILAAYPLGLGLTRAVGDAFLGAPIAYVYAPEGAALWLVGVTLLAVVASALPARGAARMRVRETLAYE